VRRVFIATPPSTQGDDINISRYASRAAFGQWHTKSAARGCI
jgi:hypothetical protein